MPLCITAAGKLTTLAVTAFTLSWTHSVEKTRWEEDWRVTPEGLEIVEARVMGSGAGMEPPPGSVLEDGWWRYVPQVRPMPSILLAASGETDGGWRLCTGRACMELGAEREEPVRLQACRQ